MNATRPVADSSLVHPNDPRPDGRHLHAVITTGTAWDPGIATHGTGRRQTPVAG